MKSYLLRINIMRQRNPMQPSKNQQTNIFDPLECSVSHLQGEAVWYLTPIIFWPIILWLKRSPIILRLKRSSWPIILRLPVEGWLVFEAIIPAQGSSRHHSALHTVSKILNWTLYTAQGSSRSRLHSAQYTYVLMYTVYYVFTVHKENCTLCCTLHTESFTLQK